MDIGSVTAREEAVDDCKDSAVPAMENGFSSSVMQ